MKQMLILSLLFLQMGIQAQSQSLTDEVLQRIACVLAEEVNHCPEVHNNVTVVVTEVATGKVKANISLQNAEGDKGESAPEYAICVYIWNKGYASNKHDKHPNLSSSESQSKHRDDWVHPCAR